MPGGDVAGHQPLRGLHFLTLPVCLFSEIPVCLFFVFDFLKGGIIKIIENDTSSYLHRSSFSCLSPPPAPCHRVSLYVRLFHQLTRMMCSRGKRLKLGKLSRKRPFAHTRVGHGCIIRSRVCLLKRKQRIEKRGIDSFLV